ncbi:MAG: MlaD family protein [Thermodesulfobacteriota bacterium]|nr:MlaD family protein [Thermodesulfobacteriota bacterium]
MEMKFSTMEKMVGALLILTIIVVTGSIIVISRGKAWFRDYGVYHIVFNEGYNLKEGATVKLFNTDVGYVTSLEITPQNKVGVTIKILKEHSKLIRRDSVAVVASPTFIGSEYISISAGSPESPLIPEEGTIPSKRRKSLGDYAEEFHLEEKFNALTRILYSLEETMDQLKDPEGPLLGTLWDLRAITNDIKRGQGLGNILVKNDLYERLDRQMAHLEVILANAEKTSQGVEQAARVLPEAMQELRKILQDIKTASRDAPAIAQGARENLQKLDQILESAKRSPLIKGGIPQKEKGIIQPDTRGVR